MLPVRPWRFSCAFAAPADVLGIIMANETVHVQH